MDKRISNPAQTVSVNDFTVNSGKAMGKRVILVNVGTTEVMLTVNNALDVTYVRYKGVNISFLSKNGFNNDKRAFGSRFEGGFIYTCGLDSFSNCRGDAYEMHGSLHTLPCDTVTYEADDDGVTVKGTVSDTALFGQNLVLKREYRITDGGIELNDTLENLAYTESEYVFLYHVNFGYPFLSESLKLNFASSAVEGTNPKSLAHIKEADYISAPVDNQDEDCYYRVMDEGRVELYNEALGFGVRFKYDNAALPELVEWRSMASGDYALGIEPATTRFSPFKMNKLAAGERVTNKLSFKFFS